MIPWLKLVHVVGELSKACGSCRVLFPQRFFLVFRVARGLCNASLSMYAQRRAGHDVNQLWSDAIAHRATQINRTAESGGRNAQTNGMPKQSSPAATADDVLQVLFRERTYSRYPAAGNSDRQTLLSCKKIAPPRSVLCLSTIEFVVNQLEKC
ncbi:unnamed protein product [Pylaiella littoralis]